MWIEDENGVWHNSDQIEKLEVGILDFDATKRSVIATHNGEREALFTFENANPYIAANSARRKIGDIFRYLVAEQKVMHATDE